MTFFSKVGSRLDMMQEMFSQTGALKEFPGSASQAASLRQAVQRCASCSHTEACQKFLDFGVTQELHDRRPPEFCANSALQSNLKASSTV